MKKRQITIPIFILFLFLCYGILHLYASTNSVSAQEDFRIEGVVINMLTGDPVPQVYVEICTDSGNKQIAMALTDENGYFHFENLPHQGPFEMGFSKSNFRSEELRNIFTSTGLIEVKLTPRGISTPAQPFTTSSPHKVYIDWPANPELNIKGYNLYRQLVTEEGTPLGQAIKINGEAGNVYSDLITGLEYVDDSISKGKFYVYQVQAISGTDRPSNLSTHSFPPVKGQWLTVSFPNVYYQSSGLYLWERDASGEPLIRIPVFSDSVYDVDASSIQIRAEFPAKLLKLNSFEVATTGITAGMQIQAEIQQADDVYLVEILAESDEKHSLYGAGELFNIYFAPKTIYPSDVCGALHLVEHIPPLQNGVIILEEKSKEPVDIILIDGDLCLEGGCLHGDVNMDGVVSLSDAQHILNYRTGLVGENTCFPYAWDINLDGRITSADATLIMRWYEGLPINPPVTTDLELIQEESFAAASNIIAKNNILKPVAMIETPVANINESVEAEIILANAPQMAGMTATIVFDASELYFNGARLGSSFSPECLIATKVDYTGENSEFGNITISIVGSNNIGHHIHQAELLILKFHRHKGQKGLIPVELSSLEINDIYGHTPRHTDPMAPEIKSIIPASIFFTILDKFSNDRILNANVFLRYSPYTEPVLADRYGIYTFPAVMPNSHYVVEVHAPGYVTKQRNLHITTGINSYTIELDKVSFENFIQMPILIGLPLVEVNQILEQHNLRIGNITYQYSQSIENNHVIEQFPAEGELISIETEINLVLSIDSLSPKCGAGCHSNNNSNNYLLGNIVILCILILSLLPRRYVLYENIS